MIIGINETDTTSKIRLENPLIGRLTDLDTTKDINLYLHNENEATNIGQRYLAYNSRFNTRVELSGHISLSDIEVGQVIHLDLEDLDNEDEIPFIGMVTSIEKNGYRVKMNVDDFGGLFVNSFVLSEDNADDFQDSNNVVRTLNGFLTADNGLNDDDESTFGRNVLV